MAKSYYEFFCPVKIIAGHKALEHIPFELDTLQAKRPMIITDKGVVAVGLLKHVEAAFADSDIKLACVFDDVPPDRPDLLGIQDTVAMMAQGSAVDRERDMLGASDLQVRMLRHIWTREIRAMEGGQKMKDWRIPRGLAVTRGVDA